MTSKRNVTISKYLSKHLRHEPDVIGLTLEPGGWLSIDALLTAAAQHGFRNSREELDEVVRDNDKQRFAIDESGTKIRANQGHSVDVDLQLAPITPPERLYHGTATRFADAIRRDGLIKMARHHVHLSADITTAQKVGMRHGKPIVFVIDTVNMLQEGYLFYRSDNGVWLVDRVPPQYLSELERSNA